MTLYVLINNNTQVFTFFYNTKLLNYVLNDICILIILRDNKLNMYVIYRIQY